GHPFGEHLAVPVEDVVGVASTSGTTGTPTFYAFSRQDVATTNELWGRAFAFAGIRPGDTVLHGFGLSMFLAGVPVVRALEAYGGMHVLAEDSCITTQLVDQETKQPVPITDGATGERVKTSLRWQAQPQLRASVGDVYQVETSPCSCGQPGPRIRVLGRTDDLLIVKGVKIYPAAVKNLVQELVPLASGAFRIVLDAPPPRVEPPLRMVVERGEGVDDAGAAK